MHQKSSHTSIRARFNKTEKTILHTVNLPHVVTSVTSTVVNTSLISIPQFVFVLVIAYWKTYSCSCVT